MYMGPLLREFSQRCAQFRVFTAEFGGDSDLAGFDISNCGPINRLQLGSAQAGYPHIVQIISPRILKYLFQYGPDLVILNEFGFLTLYASLAKLVRWKIKILLIVENRPLTLGNGLSAAVRRALRQVIARIPDAFLTNNKDGRVYLTDELHIELSKIVAKPYLVSDMSSLIREGLHGIRKGKTHTSNRRVGFLFVGELIERKGLQFALRACAMLLPKYANEFSFDIVGDGPYRETLEALASHLGLENNVCFHGRQPYESLINFYNESDVFLFPTLADYRALAPFEALTFGMPLLASIRDGGVEETIREGKNGYAFDPREVRNLSRLMARFIEDEGLIAKFSMESLEIGCAYTLPRAIEALVAASDLALTGVGKQSRR